MGPVAVILLAAAFSVALGWALQRAPIADWMRWAILAAALLAGVLMLRGAAGG